MAKIRVHTFTISLDGYGAGPEQSLKNPLGVGGRSLHDWIVPTRTFQRMIGNQDGATGPDEDLAARGIENIGAWIIGRNMFGPIRGAWPDENWKGWWGENPPYHTPVFVLTHHARTPLAMAGGTTFHFISGGVEAAAEIAIAAAKGKDVRIGGGVATIREFLSARLIDELHLAISPVLLGSGEPLFANLNLPELGYRCTKYVATAKATHVLLNRYN